MAKLIGTAGHVDHGKTTLIKALTGIDADRLPEEKRRGMTIDVGFAFIDLPDLGRVSIVDVPGHERFLTNMLVGAQGIDVALLCVAADESVMPQTREHLQILDLLPVDRLVVALTRRDLADDETCEFCRADVRELLKDTRFDASPIVAVSAFTGEGLDELRTALSSSLSEEAVGSATGPWYLPIDRAFSVKGYGCVVTGTLAGSSVSVGDVAVLEPGNREVRIRSIHVHDEPRPSSSNGMRTALNLSGVKLEEVHRGQALGQPGALFVSDILDIEVRTLTVPRHGERVRASIGSEEAIGRIFLNDRTPNVVQLRLETAVAVALNQPAIVRRYSPPDLLMGGRIVVPQAAKRSKREPAQVVEAASDDDAICSVLESAPVGITTEAVCRRLGKAPQSLGDAFQRLKHRGTAVGFAGLWLSKSAFDEAVKRMREALMILHQERPTVAFVPREAVCERAGLPWSGKPLDRIVAWLSEERLLEASGTGLRYPGFQIRLSPRQQDLLDRVIEKLSSHPIDTPNPYELSRELNAPEQAISEILRLGQESGHIVRVDEGVFYTPTQIDAIRSRIQEFAANRSFGAAELRDALGTTRKYVIPLLEYFDKIRFTTRVGGVRMVNREPTSED